jgi:elongation factor P
MIQGKRGKGGGFVRATCKNLVSGQTFEKTFTSDEIVEHAELERESVTFSWSDSNNYYFMSTETFEERVVPKAEVENGAFLQDSMEVKIVKFRDSIIGVELPHVHEYTVVSVDSTKRR